MFCAGERWGTMNTERFKLFDMRLLSWTYSMSFPLGIAAIIYLRARYGYHWPLPKEIGLIILFSGLLLLPCYIFLPDTHFHSVELKRQSIYSAVWTVLIGGWFYTKLFGDFGLAGLMAVAFGLWPRSHRELLMLQTSLRSRREPRT